MSARTLAFAAVALAAAGLTLTAAASDHGRRHERRAARAVDPTYAKECGACHLAFQPRHLPATAWRGVMGGLDRHFGVDAALDEPTRARLEAWLVEGAGRDRGGEVSLRITEQRWFVHEHDELPRGVAARPAVRTLANCAACHEGAARWDFEEDRVKIPRG